MEASKNDTSSTKPGLESLSKEELINKYKGLLNIAKKAKQAKDEFAEENRLLKEALQRTETQKEADKKALLTMKETLEQFTEQKLLLSTQLDELRQQSRQEKDLLTQLQIENESLHRQNDSLTTDNEALLNDIDAMENQLKQVNIIGMEQKKHLELLEIEVNRLKERESQTASLEQRLHVSLAENKALKEAENLAKKSLNELNEKYQHVKEINTQQRHKFKALKERFVDVYRKLKKLKECKRILLETQQEYAEAVSKWQNEIIYGARQLCEQLHSLKAENEELLSQLKTKNTETEIKQEQNDCEPRLNINLITAHLNDLENLANIALKEQRDYIKAQENYENETNEKLRSEIDDLKEKLQALSNEQEKANLTDTSQIIEKTEETQLTAVKMKTDEELLEKLKNSETNLQHLQENLDKAKQNYAELENQFKLIEDFNSKLQNECENLREQLKQYELKLAENNEISSTNSKLETDLKNFNAQLAEKTQLCEKLNNELAAISSDSLNRGKETETAQLVELTQLQTNYANQKQEYEKILMEKSEIESKNQYLIEKLEMQTTKCAEFESMQETNEQISANLKKATQELEKYRQMYEELQASHEMKVREHTDLLGEMRELNEALKKRGDLISRQETRQNELNLELKRLQQIESVLKEKEQLIQQKDYELQQINEEVKISQTKVEELTAACTRSEEQLHVITHELQCLRTQELNDAQSDAVSITSQMSRADEMNRLREVDENYEERYTKLKTLAMKLKKKLQEQTSTANELTEQLKEREIALEAQQKLNESLTAENKKLKTTRKQSNMLNLEIEAAEKSLSEVSTKLNAKCSELNELKTVLETKETTIKQLRKELSIVEAAKASECEHAKELKAQIDLLQTQIKDAVHSKQTTLDSNKDLEHALECLKLELEDLRLQLSQSESKQALKLTTLTNENSQLQAKLMEMETTLEATKQKLKSTELSLEELRVEHMEYKLKAQTVLRKQQTKDTTRERELEEELLIMRQQAQEMETLTQGLRQKLEASDKQLEILTEDNVSLLQRKEELMKQADELRLQNEALLQEQRTLLQAQQDTLRQQRQQIENLDECHKTQIERLESKFQLKLEQLKAELSKAPTTRPAPLIGAVAKATPLNLLNEQQNNRFNLHDEAHLIEREDAEGSESANVITLHSLAAKRKISNSSSSNQRRSQHELMPLDELLNAPMNTLNSETILSTNNNIVAPGFVDDDASRDDALNLGIASTEHLELQAAKERLQIQESRLRHLTALLAENEQDLAKLTQMNDMLKEELRRQERSVEREQHMHNSEYLKNVIIKFITLNSVDERTRLVPVLNTILKLSRAEAEMLNCVAKGQRVTENTRSWSNFLPSWGGGGNAANNGN